MKSPRFALVSSLLHLPALVGYNRYSICLSNALRRQSGAEWLWVTPSEGIHPHLRPLLSGTLHSLPAERSLLGSQGQFVKLDRVIRPNLYHVLTDEPVPWLVRRPVIVTCHGLPRWLRHRHLLADGNIPGSFWDYQDFPPSLGARKAMARQWLMWRCNLWRADAIIADSEYVAWELVHKFGIPARKITVVYLAAASVFHTERPPALLDEVRALYGLPARFTLAVASFSRTKNTEGLLRLAAALCRAEDPVPTVLVGPAGLRQHYAQQAAEAGMVMGRDVWLLENIPDEHLAAAYRTATVFVNLAWEESFALPIVEAMTSGTPVVASNRTAVPEIVGDGGLVVDPRNPSDVFAAVRAVLSSPDFRQEMAGHALRRSRFFSWEKAACQTLSVYDRLLAGSS